LSKNKNKGNETNSRQPKALEGWAEKKKMKKKKKLRNRREGQFGRKIWQRIWLADERI
jgi:hypothetical protein